MKVRVRRELVVSSRPTEVWPTAIQVLPKVTVVRLQEIEYLPQEMPYLVLRIETLPLVKEVLLDKNVVFQSLLESFLDCLFALDILALASGVPSI